MGWRDKWLKKKAPPESNSSRPPFLSVVVAYYKMEGQIGNTLRSLLPPFQNGIEPQDFECIVVDNGSPGRELPEEVWKLDDNIAYFRIEPEDASPNPGVAMNRAIERSRGELICLMIDGARMVTPGVLRWGVQLLNVSPRSIVEVRGWHLGPKFQPDSISEGYNEEVETRLLMESRWWENGYRLFNISAPSAQTLQGFSGEALESNCLFLSREFFDQLGGFDERYDVPGGGLVNLDFYSRATELATNVFTVLGEGTFHQTHGGAATGLPTPKLKETVQQWERDSKKLRGSIPLPDRNKYILAGHLPKECKEYLCRR